MAHIVHLTSIHPWRDTRIFIRMCQTLVKEGCSVTLIAPDAPAAAQDGVQFVTFPRPMRRYQRILVLPTLLRLALAQRADVIHFHDPELLLVGVILRICGRRVVYDVHENYTAALSNRPWIAPWKAAIIAPIWKLWERNAAFLMSGVVAATPSIAQQFSGRQVALVQNFPIQDELTLNRANTTTTTAKVPRRLMYHGGMTVLRGALTMVAAMDYLRDLDLKLLLAGPCEAGVLEGMEKTPGWDRVDYVPWLNRPELIEAMAQSLIGLVLLHPASIYVESQPTKLYEYLSVGLPVIVSDFPLWRDIVITNGCGLTADPQDPAAIAQAVRTLCNDPIQCAAMAAAALKVARQFTWENELNNLMALYRHIGVPMKPCYDENADSDCRSR